jgi:CDP-glucose 4,6-dehydratase
VLEPLSGYLWLAAVLAGHGRPFLNGVEPCSAFNFGPGPEANRTVAELVEGLLRHWPGRWQDMRNPNSVHEAHLLQLCADKARTQLKWSPVWEFAEAVEQTAVWYRDAEELFEPAQIQALTGAQIERYGREARAKKILWATAVPVLRPLEQIEICAA